MVKPVAKGPHTRNYFGPIDNVRLRPYDAAYSERYQQEVRLLAPLFPAVVVFHHIGSTAVPGLLGKPVLDIAVTLPSFPLGAVEVAAIETLGYRYWADNPNLAHQFFFKNLPRTHHLHLYPTASTKLADQLRFRDMLKASERLRAAYTALKQQLAAQLAHDREAYTAGKTDFIRRVLAGA